MKVKSVIKFIVCLLVAISIILMAIVVLFFGVPWTTTKKGEDIQTVQNFIPNISCVRIESCVWEQVRSWDLYPIFSIRFFSGVLYCDSDSISKLLSDYRFEPISDEKAMIIGESCSQNTLYSEEFELYIKDELPYQINCAIDPEKNLFLFSAKWTVPI
jgi:hypothetical protein